MGRTFAEELEALVALGPEGLGVFAASLDATWIEEGLRATGKASVRRRKFPAEQAVWLVVGMGLFADRSIQAVVEHLGLVVPGTTSLAPSAIPKARYRVGPEPLRWLFEKVSAAWRDTPGAGGYKGLTLYAVDGVCVRVQDSDENFAYFGKPGGRNGQGDAGYPQLRAACLMNLDNRMLVDARMGPYATGEQTLARQLWPQVPAASLVILDRGYFEYALFAGLLDDGDDRHLLLRLRSNIKYEELESLPDGTLLVRIRPCSSALKASPGIRESITGRIVAYHHPGGKPGRLFTTLLDPALYPAEELVTLYHERWEIELGYDELKTHLLERKECLRSKKPEGVEQEFWGLLVAYNLIRREMLLAAQEHGLPPKRISFRGALLWLRNLWVVTAWLSSPGTLPRHLADFRASLDILVLPPRRSKRRYPRHVKIKMSKYKRNRGRRLQSQQTSGSER